MRTAMKLIRGLHNLRTEHGPSAIAIGNFDGLHRGHQAIFESLRSEVGAGVAVTMVSFEPTPREFFDPENAPPRLSSFSETVSDLNQQGWVDQFLCLRFDAALAGMAPEAFVKRILVDGLAARTLVVGEDFRVAAKRAGNVDTLRMQGALHHFGVNVAQTVLHDGERISSTRIRQRLADGDVDTAKTLPRRAYAVTARVGYGQQKGRTIGFPTANLDLSRRAALRHGVYAVMVRLPGEDAQPAVANFGTRPTVNGQGEILEVHC